MAKRNYNESDSEESPSQPRNKSRRIDAESEGEQEDEEEEESGEEDSSSGEEEEDDEEEDEEEDDQLDDDEKQRLEQKILSNSRNISNHLLSFRVKAARAGGLEGIQKTIEEMNANFDNYVNIKGDNKTIENIDSRNLFEAAGQANTAIRNIKLGSTADKIDPESFARRIKHYLLKDGLVDADDEDEYLREKHDFQFYNWFRVGTYLHTRGNAISRTPSSLLEILKFEKKDKVFKPRAKKDVLAAKTTAESVSATDINENSINQTPNQVAHCFAVLKEKSPNQPINIFRYFINPRSFGQSVENMFYVSFLIRDGKLKLDVDKDGYPTVQVIPATTSMDEAQRRNSKASNHLIFQLEYDSWAYLVKELNITESYLPDRGTVH
ncbi:hypothetical protein WICPIJ_002559 [Wickerhamomyces pijperi]|uniref:Non-structural maintenance of chromosomes element 4 n=1 Tax=Wickerhamomyces pijperi TaxID=599730 RepID=A0A9P8QBH1_WICPI|nr:hypothetical protein WICPIJ_002559 [Wickerhamomyces pijperi]